MEYDLPHKLALNFSIHFIERLKIPRFSGENEIFIYGAEQREISEVACLMQYVFHNREYNQITIFYHKPQRANQYGIDLGWFLEKQKERAEFGGVVLE